MNRKTTSMEKVQATLEYSLHLEQFQNPISLRSGCWQIKTSFEVLTSIPHTIEARIFHTKDDLAYPATVDGSVLSSSEFKIFTTKHAVTIDDVVIYRVNILLDESKIEETLNSLESKMKFDIYYAELNERKNLTPICSEDMTLHFNLHRGIHGHMNIVFKTLSKLSVNVHGLLVVLQPPLKNFPEKSSVFKRLLPNRWTKAKIPTLESVIFGKDFKKKLAADGKSFVIEEKYLQHAYRFLSTLRSCLLLSYDGLYSYFTSISETLPSSLKLELGGYIAATSSSDHDSQYAAAFKGKEKLDMKARLSELSDKVTEIEDANDLPEAINGSLIEVSAQLLNLWGIFLQSSLESKPEKQQIKEEKFEKLFFSTDHPREEAILFDEKIAQRHKEIYEEVKKSPKVSNSLECPDMDIVSKSAPVIFEDRYLEPDEIDCSEDVKSSPVACTKDPRKKHKSFRTIMATDGNPDLSASFHDMPYPLKKGLFEAKKELREWISRFFSNNRSKKLTLSMELVNDSNEGISVQIRMRPIYCTTDEQVITTFVYGCRGGRTAVIGHIGNKDETLAEYDSLANRLLSQIAKLIELNSLTISRIRLLSKENKLLWEQLVPKRKVRENQSSSTGSNASSEDDGTHLVVCVHGRNGSEYDLVFVRPYIECGVTHGKTDFLMSMYNKDSTSEDIDYLAGGLLIEILDHIKSKKLIITRISFIGFSLGALVIRAALWRPEFEAYLGNLHTFLSFGGPHMGLMCHGSNLFQTGLWLEQLFDKSVSVSQMAFTDHKDPRQTFLYKLSQKTGLEHFKNVILVSALQDHIVPYHSTRIEMCKAALKGDEIGTVYTEMLRNTLEPILNNKNCNFVRYDVSFDMPKSFNAFIGRTGHCAFVSSWQFLENFFHNAGLKYFE